MGCGDRTPRARRSPGAVQRGSDAVAARRTLQEAGTMTLLVPDRSCVSGGVERIRLSLFPELARLGVEVVLAVPAHRIGAPACAEGMHLVPIEWPRGNWRRTLSALCRRLGAIWVFDRLHLARVRELQREWRADHLLYLWLVGGPLSDGDCPPPRARAGWERGKV